MATTTDHRVAPAIARDGVDTRTQDLTTHLGGGDQGLGGQTAARCGAVTKAGRPCGCRARVGFATCGRHKNVAVVNLIDVCGERKADGSYCQKACAEGDTKCKFHRTVITTREQTARSRQLRDEAWALLWSENPPHSVNELMVDATDAFDRGWITEKTYGLLTFSIHNMWNRYQWVRPASKVPPKTDLHRLALDTQNVHTKEVNQQTSSATWFLLQTSVPKDQDTFAELLATWSDKQGAKRVLTDMCQWYQMETCVTQGDYLYGRMLDGLWTRIKAHKEREELTQRLWEEASESVNKCCQGHLSRLANVLVGFTDEVKAEVPVGELLQQKMAAIAAKDIPVEQKVEEARAVCEELKVPEAERAAWLEAF